MTVAELIEQLSKMPQDSVVLVPDIGCGCCCDFEGYEPDDVEVRKNGVHIS
jgi:hypothetical protein